MQLAFHGRGRGGDDELCIRGTKEEVFVDQEMERESQREAKTPKQVTGQESLEPQLREAEESWQVRSLTTPGDKVW